MRATARASSSRLLTGSVICLTSTTERARRVTPITVADNPRRRTASWSRSSWVKTMTWRVFAVSASARASPSTLDGSIDWTGSSMDKNRTLSENVARGRTGSAPAQLQLPLAHDAQRFRGTAIDRDLQRDAATLRHTFEADSSKGHVAEQA